MLLPTRINIKFYQNISYQHNMYTAVQRFFKKLSLAIGLKQSLNTRLPQSLNERQFFNHETHFSRFFTNYRMGFVRVAKSSHQTNYHQCVPTTFVLFTVVTISIFRSIQIKDSSLALKVIVPGIHLFTYSNTHTIAPNGQ